MLQQLETKKPKSHVVRMIKKIHGRRAMMQDGSLRRSHSGDDVTTEGEMMCESRLSV